MAVDLSTSKATEIQRLLGFQVGLSLFELPEELNNVQFVFET